MKISGHHIRYAALVLLLFVTAVSGSRAETMHIITSREGLSSMSVFCLHQDRSGYMWAGTYEGLNRHRGYDIDVFRSGFGDTGEISGFLIEKIHESDDGALWVHSNYGYDRFNPATMKAEHHPEVNGSYKSAVSPSGMAVAMEANGTFYYYDSKERKFIAAELPGVKYSDVVCFAFDGNERLLVARPHDLLTFTYSPDASGKRQFVHEDTLPFNTPVKYMCKAAGGGFYIVDENYAIYILDANLRELKFVCGINPPSHMRGLIGGLVCADDRIVVGFKSEGAMIVTPATGDVRLLDIPFGVFDLCYDSNQHVLWAATDGGGIYTYCSGPFDFDGNFFRDFPDLNISKQARALYHDKNGDYWIGTKGDGLYQLSRDAEGRPVQRRHTVANSALSHDMVFNIIPGQFHDVLWLGGEGNGLCYYSFADSRVKRLDVSGTPQFRCIHAVAEVSDSVLWAVSNWHGLFRVTLDTTSPELRIKSVTQELINVSEHGSSQFFTIRRQGKRWLWFANRENGVYRLDLMTGEVCNILFDYPRELAVNDVHSICTEVPDRVLVGTSAGLIELTTDISGKVYKRRLCHELTGNKSIRSIVTDGERCVWLASVDGLLHLDIESGNVTAWSGGSITEFCDNAGYYDAATRTFFFGGTDAVITVTDDAGYKAADEHLPVIFECVDDGRKEFALSKYSDSDGKLVFSHDETYLGIKYNVLDYSNTDDYLFEYRIPGVSSGWLHNGTRRLISFLGMSPGSYNLEVRYRKGNYISPVYQAGLLITPPWYASWWAKTIYVLCAIAAVLGLVRAYRWRQRRKMADLEARHKEEVYESKLDFFQGVANEFAEPLMLISGSGKIVASDPEVNDRTRKFASIIYHKASVLKELTQKLVGFRNVDSGQSESLPVMLNVTELARDVEQRFGSLARMRSVDFRLDCADNLMWVADAESLKAIVAGITSVAIKHLPAGGQLVLSVLRSDEALTVTFTLHGATVYTGYLSGDDNKQQLLDRLQDHTADVSAVLDDLDMAICRNRILDNKGTVTDCVTDSGTQSITVSLPPREAVSDTASAMVVETVVGRSPLPAADSLGDETIAFNERLQTILFVDDSREMCWYIRNLFRGEFNVVACGSVADAIESVGQRLPDLVIADLLLKDRTGIELCRELKGRKNTEHIPFILISSVHSDEVRRQSIDAGADIFMYKPYDEDNFHSVVSGMLRRSEVLLDYYDDSISSYELVDGVVMHKEEKEMLAKMTSIISDNICNPELSTEMVASMMGMTVRNLYRFVSRITTDTPSSIIRNMRLKRAAYLLKHSRLTMEEVAFKSGFNHRSTFYNVFTAKYGCTPKQFHDSNCDDAVSRMDS